MLHEMFNKNWVKWREIASENFYSPNREMPFNAVD